LKTTSANFENLPDPPPAETTAELPVWLQRLFVIVYVVFCLELGIVLLLLPWSDFWTNNGLWARWPLLRPWMQHGFTRGAISGLGLLDLWLAIYEAIHYRDRR
jgi:hypothetical protein